MGKAIENIALQRGHEIAGLVGKGHSIDEIKRPVDVAIEFTTPESAADNVIRCIDLGVPVVCGTTGWLDRQTQVNDYCRKKGGTFFYASNFSLGVNIFFKLNEHLARLMATQSGYDVQIDETHHTQKKDAPSGTAITLAQGIMANLPLKKQWVKDETRKDDDLVIRSFRTDPTPGTHLVRYHSEVDDIVIEHTAHSRQGFALGAVAVAEWLPGRQGVLTMDDFLKF